MDSIITEKVCRRCGETKSNSEFPKNRTSKDGTENVCKRCKYLRSAIVSKDSRIRASKRYYKSHLGEIKIKFQKYYQNNKDTIKENVAKYQEKNNNKIKANKSRYYFEHKEQISLSKKYYEQAHKQQYNSSRRKSYNKYKEQFLDMYGRKCVCCGETHTEFLTIDHIQGQRGRKKEGSHKAYRNATKNFNTNIYRILCMNCNFSIGKYGYCPHNNDIRTLS